MFFELMNPASSLTTLLYHTLVQRLENLDPEAAQHVSHANAGCECFVWIAQQAAFCSQRRLILALPEVMLWAAQLSIWSCQVYQR